MSSCGETQPSHRRSRMVFVSPCPSRNRLTVIALNHSTPAHHPARHGARSLPPPAHPSGIHMQTHATLILHISDARWPGRALQTVPRHHRAKSHTVPDPLSRTHYTGNYSYTTTRYPHSRGTTQFCTRARPRQARYQRLPATRRQCRWPRSIRESQANPAKCDHLILVRTHCISNASVWSDAAAATKKRDHEPHRAHNETRAVQHQWPMDMHARVAVWSA